jgi:hypothetical protein
LPYDINFVSNCHLDWIGFALKHVYCLFSPRVLTNFGRIKVRVNFALSRLVLREM